MTQPDVLPKAKLKVLVADDNQETRRAVRMMLSINPDVTIVAIAQDGQEAVDLAREYRPDLVVLDINMPKKDGLTAFKEMIQAQPSIGGIIISSEMPAGLTGDDILPGIQEFLLKPFDYDEFNDAVRRVADSVRGRRFKVVETEQINKAHEENLKKLASEYARSRRTDDEAVGVFEELASNPACELRWLQMLVIEYTIRQDWPKLKALAARLEQQAPFVKK